MKRTVPIDINHQVVSEPAEALADDDAAPVIRLDRAEDERHLLTGRVDDSEPAVFLLDDGGPAREGRPEFKERTVYLLRKTLRSF